MEGIYHELLVLIIERNKSKNFVFKVNYFISLLAFIIPLCCTYTVHGWRQLIS